jgi:glycosyltransferase involved in cell wall biosynthesis
MSADKTIILIPAFQPSDALISLTEDLHRRGFFIVCVDDGSGSDFDDIFRKTAEYAEVLRYPSNRGKGGALKFGLKHILTNPACDSKQYIVTADADGQHSVKDILRVRDELKNGARFVLTTRLLNRKIPFRSKFGNDLSRVIYTLATGKYFTDNQSELRGFSVENAEWLLKVNGEKYDYEMNMLYFAAKQNLFITTIDIEAIYIDGNKSSHFNPFLDTLRIYRLLFKSARASIVSAALAQMIVFVCAFFTETPYDGIYIAAAGFTAGLLTYLLNKFWVFRKVDCRDGRTFIFTVARYTVYALISTAVLGIAPWMPLYIIFNICLLTGIPARYYLHKYISALN